jgi:putative phage-type endonuclease
MTDDRRGFLGATDVAAIAGLHPYRSPLQVWMEKTGNATLEPETAAMRRGLLFEPIVAQMYTEATGVELQPIDRVQMRKFPYLCASPDRVSTPDSSGAVYLVELKTHREFLRDQYGAEGSDEVPAHELVQVIWQMHVVGERLGPQTCAEIAVLFGTDDFGIWGVGASPAFAAELQEMALRFWSDHVVTEVPPPASDHPKEVEALRRLYPRHTEIAVRATDELEVVIDGLRTARAEIAEAERRASGLQARIQQFMGEAGTLEFGVGEKITWRTSRPSLRRSCDYDALRKAAPDVYDTVVTERETDGSRRFCVPRSWGKDGSE